MNLFIDLEGPYSTVRGGGGWGKLQFVGGFQREGPVRHTRELEETVCAEAGTSEGVCRTWGVTWLARGTRVDALQAPLTYQAQTSYFHPKPVRSSEPSVFLCGITFYLASKIRNF